MLENEPQLKISDVLLIHCNIINNQYKHDLKVWSTFVPSKSFVHLLNALQKIRFSQKYFFQCFYTLKYGLLIKILFPWR